MSTRAQRAFAYVDDAARDECQNGEWLPDVGEWWGEYENIVATHVTRRLRGEWAIDLTVVITWDGAEPITRERTTKFGTDWHESDIRSAVSHAVGVMIQADRFALDGEDFDAAYERICREQFLAVLTRGR